jgi:regulatory protein
MCASANFHDILVRMGKGTRDRMAGATPTEGTLRDAALSHLARYGTTRAGLLRVLDRRIDRWAHLADAEGLDSDLVAGQATAARVAARRVVARLAEVGAVDDAAFAAARARSLTRAGRSRRAVAAHLAVRGVDGETLAASLPANPEAELAAALALARRRRLGPFGSAAPDGSADDADRRRRELGVLARAGFSQDLARRALEMAPDEAEAIVVRLRRE